MITFITSNYIFLWKRRILLSNCSKILGPLETYKNLTFMFIINAIVIVKAFDKN